MAADNIFWMGLWEKLGLINWQINPAVFSPKPFPWEKLGWEKWSEEPSVTSPDPVSAVIEAPDFRPEAKDFSGALLFDTNGWVEEQHLLLSQPLAGPPDSESPYADTLVLKYCVPRPVEEAIFRPQCLVVQHQPRFEIRTITSPVQDTPLDQSLPENTSESMLAQPMPPLPILIAFTLLAFMCIFQLSTWLAGRWYQPPAGHFVATEETDGQETITEDGQSSVPTELEETRRVIDSISQSLGSFKIEGETLHDTTERVVKLLQKHSGLEDSFQTLSTDHQSLGQEKYDVDKKCESLQAKCNTFQKEAKEKDLEIAQSQEIQKSLQTQVDHLGQGLKSRDTTIEGLENAKASAVTNLNNQLNKTQADAKAQSQAVDQLQATINGLNEETKSVKSSIASEKEEVARLREELVSLTTSKDSQIQELQNSKAVSEEEVQSLHRTISCQDGELTALREAKEDLKAQSVKKDAEFAAKSQELAGSSKQQLENHAKEEQHLRDEARTLKEQLKGKNSELEKKQALIVQLTNENKALQGNVDLADEQQATIEEVKSNAAEQQLKLEEKEIFITKQRESIARLDNEKQALAAEADSNIAKQKAIIADKNKLIDQQREAIAQLTTEKQAISGEAKSQITNQRATLADKDSLLTEQQETIARLNGEKLASNAEEMKKREATPAEIVVEEDSDIKELGAELREQEREPLSRPTLSEHEVKADVGDKDAAEVQAAATHIFKMPKVKDEGHGPGDLVLSRWAPKGNAAAPLPLVQHPPDLHQAQSLVHSLRLLLLPPARWLLSLRSQRRALHSPPLQLPPSVDQLLLLRLPPLPLPLLASPPSTASGPTHLPPLPLLPLPTNRATLELVLVGKVELVVEDEDEVAEAEATVSASPNCPRG